MRRAGEVATWTWVTSQVEEPQDGQRSRDSWITPSPESSGIGRPLLDARTGAAGEDQLVEQRCRADLDSWSGGGAHQAASSVAVLRDGRESRATAGRMAAAENATSTPLPPLRAPRTRAVSPSSSTGDYGASSGASWLTTRTPCSSWRPSRPVGSMTS